MSARIGFEEFRALAEGRSKLYGFLSSLYLQIPDADLVNSLLSNQSSQILNILSSGPELSNEMTQGLGEMREFIEKAKEISKNKLQEELAVDWTKLFRGVKPGYGPRPPLESIYLDSPTETGDVMSEIADEYSRAEANLNPRTADRPDYIGMELDFLRLLTEKEALMWKSGNREYAVRYLRQQKSFLDQHVMRWVPSFCDAASDHTSTSFFKGVIHFTRGYLNLDFESIPHYLEMVNV